MKKVFVVLVLLVGLIGSVWADWRKTLYEGNFNISIEEFWDDMTTLEEVFAQDKIKRITRVNKEQTYMVWEFMEELKDEYFIMAGDCFTIISTWHSMTIYWYDDTHYVYALFVATDKTFPELLIEE
ncbi:hypothetical protein AGMMS49991_05610 [Spirochaetia bacterium]|nr:hypothetical protein AGMMS49991_05610 [Spirochaetia bacterium]